MLQSGEIAITPQSLRAPADVSTKSGFWNLKGNVKGLPKQTVWYQIHRPAGRTAPRAVGTSQ